MADALLAIVAACEQALSIDGQVTVAPHAVEACGMTLTSGACQACVQAHCCTELQGCATAASCNAYETCLLACGSDYACRAQCLVDHPIGNGGSEVPSLDQCVVTQCEVACGTSCGLAAAYAVGDAAVPCQECIGQFACEQGKQCGSDVACQAATRCGTSCATPDCRFGCLADAPDAAGDAALHLAIAVGGACLPACGVGSNWECVGHVHWPPAKAQTLTAVLQVAEASNVTTNIEGVSVKACFTSDPSCDSPVATGTTDKDGIVRLDVPTNKIDFGFQGYFDVTKPGYLPSLYFLSYPLSEPIAPLTMLFATESWWTKFTALGGVTLDPARGHLLGTPSDCFIWIAPNVRIAVDRTDSESAIRYLDGTSPSASLDASTRFGYGYVFNVPNGPSLTVTATPVGFDHPSSVAKIFTRPGTMSIIDLLPTPSP